LKKNAVFDSTSTYRYSLTRVWDENKDKAVFIMLNPSIANEEEDDKTTKRCLYFAENFGFGSIEIVNLFALVATDYNALKKVSKEVAIGPENEKYIIKALNSADMAIAAWGENCTIHERHKDILELFQDYLIHRLGTPTKDGHPRHPLYLRKDTQLEHQLKPQNLKREIIKTTLNANYKGREQRIKDENRNEKNRNSHLWCTICHEEYSLDGINVCVKCVEMLVGKYKQGAL
jgi:hypothetical protein